MATGAEVLSMLIPNGGWVISADEFESIRYDEGIKPLTKKEFDDGFKAYDEWASKKEAEKSSQKEALLQKLGITPDEAKLLFA